MLRDSGERTEYSTGAVRDRRTGKGRYDLIPTELLIRLAKHYENGAVKYNDRNWEKGMPISNFVDSAFRHLVSYMAGDTEEDNLAAIVWNVAGIMHFEKYGDPELFDMPIDYKK